MTPFVGGLKCVVLLTFLLPLACSQPPEVPTSAGNAQQSASPDSEPSADASQATSFSSDEYFNSGCQNCHSGDQPVFDLSGGGFDGPRVEEAKTATASHDGFADGWPSGADAEALAEYINSTIAGE
jgi:cytochrome c5